MELRRLRYFLTVADERNFTRAAERLHVAQPALSRQLRLLEEDLGVELMRRTTHTFELTDAGEYLLEHGSELLERAEALDRTLRSFGAGSVGRVFVAYGTSAAYDTAPRLLAAVAEQLPRLTWVPLRQPAALEVRLMARALNRTPAVSRFLAAAQAVADDLSWRTGG